ncbi:Paf1-domain-containing protein [Polyplosphaeria fusca]|uniref:Paf1-domain-containing protein n=1 Tax=Polyplosphaeria fusca TaxID=682080 RepID=A0A9P4V0L6_9PLEO|nr:Paf1-domain-containing protein [Polyplosphaeria fusca]
MASSGRQNYHQDYIARIRYSNALPPPPCPPKLLDIPNTGLSSGQYTSAGFASRLAREQPLNIEADAELGMPIDLVGIPGVFDGDESAIQTVHHPPVLHTLDKALMRHPNQLGKSSSGASGVSFLRKTEYITSMTAGGSRFESSNSANTMRVRGKRRRAEMSEDDPTHIAKHILKGFDLAYPADAYTGPDVAHNLRPAESSQDEKRAWKTPTHPTNSALHLVDSYPILPDWDALPDTGSYMMYKILNLPSTSLYDSRLDVAILRPTGETIPDNEQYLQDLEKHKSDPTHPMPIPRYQYEFFLPSSSGSITDAEKASSIKRSFATYEPDDPTLPFDVGEDDEGNPKRMFKYENIRTYETRDQHGDPEDAFNDVVAMAIHDPEAHEDEPLRDVPLQKAAYFYPIVQKTSIRPRRPGRVDMVGGEDAATKVHVIEAVARDARGEAEKREAVRARYDGGEAAV